ncbi:MAG: PAS domain S-box protein [Candidatus Sulfomarinibacteraceae bacterium]
MVERKRILVLILIMAAGSFLVAGVAIWILYEAAFEEERSRLIEAAKSQARLIEAMARHDRRYSTEHSGTWQEATLSQVEAAHREYEGFGETGEFVLARREGGFIVFLFKHRHQTVTLPEPLVIDTHLALPMRRALFGHSGTVVGLDYRGERVLAAHEPVAELDLGIVAKIDLAEVRAPFIRAGLAAAGFALVVVAVGSVLLVRVSRPLVTTIERRTRDLEESIAALKESENRFRTTFELAGTGIVQGSLDGRFTRMNQRFCQIVGYTPAELLELGFQDLTHPDDLEEELETLQRVIDGELDAYSMEKRYLRKDSTVVWVNLVVTVVRDETGAPDHFIGVIDDITERRRSQQVLQNSLAEKDVLLREIHHRVKNNMQVISSLLNLQSHGAEDERLVRLFEESQNRVRAMALIHEILYENSNLARIDLGEYVSKLATSLIRMYGTDSGRIDLNIKASGVTLEIDDTMPCGLVINELLSNSLKYAFRDGRNGEISIEATREDNGTLVLQVSDDGIGIPAEIDYRNTETMGMRLVTGLVESQLGGQVSLDLTHGTCFTITFDPTEQA